MSMMGRWMAAAALMAITVTTSGCATMGTLFGTQRKPTIELQSVELTSVSPMRVGLRLRFTVDNPYGVGLPATGFDYRIALAGVQLTEGNARFEHEIPPHGQAPLTTELSFGTLDAAQVAARILAGQRDYRIDGTVTVQTPVGALGVDVAKQGRI